ncbi:MAG: hypothetical protein HY351_01190 [Candidatus Omnitrophica bacterium]|nr:hypothetical protein [Candidatus Omnitrophota bacterium]
MQRSLYKELWTMRFQRMLVLERQGVLGYRDLLKECRGKLQEEPLIQTHLKKLIADETKHVKLVKELLDITSRQQD